MSVTAKIIKYEIQNVVRSKWIIIYSLFFFLITDGFFRFGGTSARVTISLMNIILMIIPLVSIIFGTVYIYNSREFIELLLSQPINRKSMFTGLFFGLSTPLALGFALGTGLPFLWHGTEETNIAMVGMLLASGMLLTFVFTAMSFFLSFRYEDKARGLGMSIFLWLALAVLYDGLVLFIAYSFSDYPLETPMIVISMLNPIDLARTLLLLQSDMSALMGYTGAIFQQFFGSATGIYISFASLLFWLGLPFLLGARLFTKKDF